MNFSLRVGLWKLSDYPEYLSALLLSIQTLISTECRNYPAVKKLLAPVSEALSEGSLFYKKIDADVFGNIGENSALIVLTFLLSMPQADNLTDEDKSEIESFINRHKVQIDLSARALCAAELQNKLYAETKRLYDTLMIKSREFSESATPRRDHLQNHGELTSMGKEFEIYAAGVLNSLNALQMAVFNTGIKESSQLSRPDYLNSSSELLFMHAAVQFVSMQLWRIANDLRLKASGPRAGLSEISLPAVAPGSSIMPGKLNPVIAEMVYATVDQVDANHASIAAAVKSGWLESSSASGVVIRNFIESSRLLRRTIGCFIDKCLLGVEPIK